MLLTMTYTDEDEKRGLFWHLARWHFSNFSLCKPATWLNFIPFPIFQSAITVTEVLNEHLQRWNYADLSPRSKVHIFRIRNAVTMSLDEQQVPASVIGRQCCSGRGLCLSPVNKMPLSFLIEFGLAAIERILELPSRFRFDHAQKSSSVKIVREPVVKHVGVTGHKEGERTFQAADVGWTESVAQISPSVDSNVGISQAESNGSVDREKANSVQGTLLCQCVCVCVCVCLCVFVCSFVSLD